MTVEAPQGLGEQFLSEVTSQIERVFAIPSEIDKSPIPNGRIVRFNGNLRGTPPVPLEVRNISFAEKDFSDGLFVKKALLLGPFLTQEGNISLLLRVTEKVNGIKEVVVFYDHDPVKWVDSKRIPSKGRIISLVKADGKWKVHKIVARDGENKSTLESADEDTYSALDRTLDFVRLAVERLPDAVRKKMHDSKRDEEMLALLE